MYITLNQGFKYQYRPWYQFLIDCYIINPYHANSRHHVACYNTMLGRVCFVFCFSFFSTFFMSKMNNEFILFSYSMFKLFFMVFDARVIVLRLVPSCFGPSFVCMMLECQYWHHHPLHYTTTLLSFSPPLLCFSLFLYPSLFLLVIRVPKSHGST